jgi:hypothetical protein
MDRWRLHGGRPGASACQGLQSSCPQPESVHTQGLVSTLVCANAESAVQPGKRYRASTLCGDHRVEWDREIRQTRLWVARCCGLLGFARTRQALSLSLCDCAGQGPKTVSTVVRRLQDGVRTMRLCVCCCMCLRCWPNHASWQSRLHPAGAATAAAH